MTLPGKSGEQGVGAGKGLLGAHGPGWGWASRGCSFLCPDFSTSWGPWGDTRPTWVTQGHLIIRSADDPELTRTLDPLLPGQLT